MNPRIVIGCIHFLKKKGQLLSVKQPKGTDLHFHLMATEEGHTYTHMLGRVCVSFCVCVCMYSVPGGVGGAGNVLLKASGRGVSATEAASLDNQQTVKESNLIEKSVRRLTDVKTRTQSLTRTQVYEI